MRSMKCLALHGRNGTVDFLSLYRGIRNYCEQFELELANPSYMVKDWPKSKRMGSTRFEDVIKGESSLTAFGGEFQARVGAALQPAYFSIVASDFSLPKVFVSVPAELEKIHPLESLARSLLVHLEACYGYVMAWDRDSDPSFYASGITHVLAGQFPDEAESKKLSRWSNELALASLGRRYLNSGLVREVYESNFLNAHHLARTVDGLSLPEAVVKFQWGCLERVAAANWLWRVAASELDRINISFEKAGLVI